jgi:hypothetical protein
VENGDSAALATSVPAETPASASRWFPSGATFEPLMVAPREVHLRGSLVGVSRSGDNDYGGTRLEAEVGLAYRTNIFRLSPGGQDRPVVDLGFEVGLFSRFFLEEIRRDLIHADYRVGAPLSLAVQDWEARLTLLHISSHLGDDYLRRFDLTTTRTAQDGFELFVARRVGADLRIYGGGFAHFHVSGGGPSRAIQGGFEWNPVPAGNRTALWPFVAAHFSKLKDIDGIAGTGAAGVGMRVGATVLQWEVRGHFGPSPMGQFYTTTENLLGIGVRVIPGGGS